MKRKTRGIVIVIITADKVLYRGVQGTAQNAEKTKRHPALLRVSINLTSDPFAPNASTSLKQCVLTSPRPRIMDLLWLLLYFLPLLCHLFITFYLVLWLFIYIVTAEPLHVTEPFAWLTPTHSLRFCSGLLTLLDSPVWIRYFSSVCPPHLLFIIIVYKCLLVCIPTYVDPTSQYQGTCLMFIWIFSTLHNTATNETLAKLFFLSEWMNEFFIWVWLYLEDKNGSLIHFCTPQDALHIIGAQWM